MLRECHDVDVLATDLLDPSASVGFDARAPCYTAVTQLGAVEAVDGFVSMDRDALLLAWPLPEVSLSAVERFASSVGRLLVYIGEAEGQGTAGPGFEGQLRQGGFAEVGRK
eukprot:Polyplicarium_translucidae@DN1783_c0_g1_i1.p1